MSTSNSSDASGLPDAGFTGLEAAIVLIAFVVVAAVFAYIALAMGLFFSEESQSTVHQGIRQAGSACMVSGSIHGVSEAPYNYIDSVIIPIKLTVGGEPIDMTTVSVRFVGRNHMIEIDRNDPLVSVNPKRNRWSIQERLNGDSDLLLEAGEEYVLNITLENRKDCAPYRSFAIEIKPAGRAALRVERTVPGSISQLTRLD
ncbi:archaellin/type IV pilin N-terminal domain-containing protein [Methanoculleus sp.]|uniref:archaellin/type IV pilin N-terminal domain-containing protein n=1 Tax=Methanoculleus sp. TaxID=90427 RepID=UPI0025FB6B77|nr:archaellin/type IV pilin N-terminal domain-containing protein [Methanoculleus sp.]